VAPGVWHVPAALTPDQQAVLAARCVELGARPAGFYTPVVRGGGRMRLRMMCLGRHWNPKTYTYESQRSDHDGLPVQALPDDFARLARDLAATVDARIEPDICLVNWYGDEGKLGLHQDKDESAASLAAGIPVVSISLGDRADFALGGTRRQERVRVFALASGDAVVMGGPGRLRYHGVLRIQPGSGPSSLGLAGRLSLTFRQY
jgi:DNA alkylation damage repair protein AlkB